MKHSLEKLAELKSALSPHTTVTLLPHTDPDPDAIAATVALGFLLTCWGKTVETYYEGRIGRAENTSLMNFLKRPITPLLDPPPAPIILIDTQPANGNNPLLNAPIWGAIDHHSLKPSSQKLPFSDIRPEIGSTSTMVTEYLQCAELVPDAKLATALFYGIKSDTRDLKRHTTPNDIASYDYLRPLINQQALTQIEKAQVSTDYFHHAFDGLKNAQVYKNLLVSYLGEMSYPDLPAELADWLLRYEEVNWVVCAGLYNETIRISVRAHPVKGTAREMAQEIVRELGVGGGHDMIAGGQVPLNGKNPLLLIRRMRDNALRYLDIPEDTLARGLLE